MGLSFCTWALWLCCELPWDDACLLMRLQNQVLGVNRFLLLPDWRRQQTEGRFQRVVCIPESPSTQYLRFLVSKMTKGLCVALKPAASNILMLGARTLWFCRPCCDARRCSYFKPPAAAWCTTSNCYPGRNVNPSVHTWTPKACEVMTPKLLERAQKAMVLHSLAVQAGLLPRNQKPASTQQLRCLS